MKKQLFKHLIGGMLMLAMPLMLTSCEGMLDDIFGEWSRPTGNNGNTKTTVAVKSVTLDQTTLTKAVGDDAVTLTATVDPSDASDKTVTWKSSDASIAAVDANGKVTFVAAGSATITATATNGTEDTADDKTAECAVTVNAAAAARSLTLATTDDVGKIAGADGKIYATKADAEAVATGNAVAMIAYVGSASDCDHGLAIALADESGTMNWSTAGTTCSSKTPVGAWRLPSAKDWQYMFIGCGSSESYSAPTPYMTKSYSGLASKLTTAQGDALQDGSYWSSSEFSPGIYAWYVYFGDSLANFNFDYVDDVYDEYQVRACLAF